MAKVGKKVQKSMKKPLEKQMWTKYISKGVSISLMKYNPSSILFKAYKNTSYCNELKSSDKSGRLTSTYCKNRWCQTCTRIKSAILINGYYPQLEKFVNPVFVTLTLPTCIGEDLVGRIKEMEEAWRLLYQQTKKSRFKRIYGTFIGIRKAEVTIRPNGLYHYHYHFVIDGIGQGEWLIKKWLKMFPSATPKAQNLRKVDEFGKSEIFKYAIKCEVKTDNRNAKRYDLVFNALRGKRTFSAFGGIRKIKEDFEDKDLKSSVVIDEIEQNYKWMKDDWYNIETGEGLVKIPIPEKVKKLVHYPNEN